MTEAASGREFGRIAALDGWTLDSARELGAITGFDRNDVEHGYREVKKCP